MTFVVALIAAVLGVFAWLAVVQFVARRLPNEQTAPVLSYATRRPIQPSETLAVTVSLLLALSLRVPLMDRGLAHDEVWSAIEFIEADTAWQTASRYIQYNNHILYSLAARLAESALGRAEWVLRLPALLLGLATIPALWLAARERFGSVAAMGAAFAIATSSVHIGFSVSARGYTGLVFFSLVSSALFLKWVRSGASRAEVAGYVVVSVLGIYMHLYTVVVVGVQAFFLIGLSCRELLADPPALMRKDHLRGIGAALAAIAALSLICYTPVLEQLAKNIGGGERSAFQPMLPFKVLGYLTGSGILSAKLLLGATALGGWVWTKRQNGLEVAYTALVCVLPICAVWLARPEFVRERFFIFLLPCYALGLALGVEAFAHMLRSLWPRSRPAVLAVCAIFGTSVAWSWASSPWSNIPTGGFREAVASLEAPTPDRLVGTCALGLGVDLYAWYARDPIFVPESVPEFNDWVSQYDEVRCAVRSPFNLTAHQSIANRLATQVAVPERYHVISVYRYVRPPG